MSPSRGRWWQCHPHAAMRQHDQPAPQGRRQRAAPALQSLARGQLVVVAAAGQPLAARRLGVAARDHPRSAYPLAADVHRHGPPAAASWARSEVQMALPPPAQAQHVLAAQRLGPPRAACPRVTSRDGPAIAPTAVPACRPTRARRQQPRCWPGVAGCGCAGALGGPTAGRAQQCRALAEQARAALLMPAPRQQALVQLSLCAAPQAPLTRRQRRAVALVRRVANRARRQPAARVARAVPNARTAVRPTRRWEAAR